MSKYSKDVRRINPRQARFIEEYLKDGNGKRAAIAAGYAPKTADHRASELLLRSPSVMNAIEIARTEAMKRAGYNLTKAMEETDVAIHEAKAAKQYTAVAKLIEHKARLNGLLIEKHDHRIAAGFQIQIIGVERK